MPAKRLQISVGGKYGKLTVLKECKQKKWGQVVWDCLCECGRNRIATSYNLKRGITTSCGCVEVDRIANLNKTHGLSQHPIYKTWQQMKKRCYSEKYEHFEHYGGKGVIVCAEWINDFSAFYNWSMNNDWQKGLTIDRYPNKNGNYEPSNCRWANWFQQAGNKNNNRMLTVNGVCATMSEFSRTSGLNITTIYGRIKAGWSEHDAVTKPKNTVLFRN
jgi:hypothetical protein